MGHTASAYIIANPTKITTGGMWGPIHELGHNQQRSCWEFPSHTTEATCNLWSVYVHEELLGIKRTKVAGCSPALLECSLAPSVTVSCRVV